MHFEEWMQDVVKAFEIAGVVILALGSIVALAQAGILLRRGEQQAAYMRARRGIGRSILLGLEVLIIADIVQTITIDPTSSRVRSLRSSCWFEPSSASHSRSSSKAHSPGVAKGSASRGDGGLMVLTAGTSRSKATTVGERFERRLTSSAAAGRSSLFTVFIW